MSQAIKILHNPRCSKSRETLALLEARGEVEVVEYLKKVPTRDELHAIVNKLGMPARSIIRVKEDAFKEIEVDLDDDEAVLSVLLAHPTLIERPIVIRGDRAVIGRPPENIERLFEKE